MGCNHARLVKCENVEMGGASSTTYECLECHDLFTISPFTDGPVVFGTTGYQDSTCIKSGCDLDNGIHRCPSFLKM